jgi:hypothetical protein
MEVSNATAKDQVRSRRSVRENANAAAHARKLGMLQYEYEIAAANQEIAANGLVVSSGVGVATSAPERNLACHTAPSPAST